jgi:hypothetical protein
MRRRQIRPRKKQKLPEEVERTEGARFSDEKNHSLATLQKRAHWNNIAYDEAYRKKWIPVIKKGRENCKESVVMFLLLRKKFPEKFRFVPVEVWKEIARWILRSQYESKAWF